MKKSLIIFTVLIITFSFFSCGEKLTQKEIKYMSEVIRLRNGIDDYMKNNPNSPFNHNGKVEFHPLNYFDVDFSFVSQSELYEYEKKDTIVVFGTKGEERQAIRFGYFPIKNEGKEFNLNLYESSANESGQKYYSIWFTDRTTNNESYGVGRYINFEKNDDPDYLYLIDFNFAYNPYCAYSPDYSCAIPTINDYIDIAITAGEKKFHD